MTIAKTRKPKTVDPMAQVIDAMENCHKVILALQAKQEAQEARIYQLECELASLSLPVDPVPVTRAKVKAKGIPAMFVSAPKSTGTKPVPHVRTKGSDDLLTRCVEAAIANIRKGTYSEKVTSCFEGDIRCFLTPALRKEIKAYREQSGVRLAAFSRDLAAAYEARTGTPTIDLF